MSAKDSFDKNFIQDNIVESNRETKSRVAELEVAENNALQNGDPIVGSIIIATTNPENADPTSSDYDGAFISGEEIEMADGSQPSWLAKLAAGIVEFSIGSAIGIYLNRLTQGYKHIADDGTTFRKGELGMTTLEGRTAPSFGITYSDNSTPSELLTNGGFETGDFTGWTAVSGTWVIDSDSYSGNYAGLTTSSSGEKNQIVDVSAGSILQVQGAIKKVGGGADPKIQLDFYSSTGGGGTLVSTTTPIIGGGVDYIFYSRLVLVPTGAQSVSFRIIAGTGAAIHFDDLSLSVNSIVNYIGFEPVLGKLVSNQLDADGQLGQIPVGEIKVPRVDDAKDKLAHTLTTGGAVDVGTHYYITTFVDQYGETDADLTQYLTVGVPNTTNDRVALTSIPIGKWGTIARRIYRTKVLGSPSTNPLDYFLVTTIGDNTTTTYNDDATDASLPATTIPTINTTASRPAFPKRWTIFGDDIITSVTMTNNITAGLTHNYGFYVGPTGANAADGNLYTADVWLEAGTYTLYHYSVTTPDSGKLDYYLDNVLVQSGIDWYSAAGTFNVTKSFSLTVPTSGYHVLEMKVNGQNASATDYRVFFTKITFRPTAY